jgi:hypothetical protein
MENDMNNSNIWLVTSYFADGCGELTTSLLGAFSTKEEAIKFGKWHDFHIRRDQYNDYDYDCDFLIASEMVCEVKVNYYRQSYVLVEEYQLGTEYQISAMVID